MPPPTHDLAVADPPSSPGTALSRPEPPNGRGFAAHVLTAAVSGSIGFGVGGVLHPEQVKGWIDLIAIAGMPGTILFLIAWIGYMEFRKVPALEARIQDGEMQRDRLYERRIFERDQVAERNITMAEARVLSQEKLASSFDRLSGNIEKVLQGGG